MGWYAQSAADEYYQRLPKVDLHRHLEGTLRVETLLEIAHQQDLTLPGSADALRALVQIQHNEPLNSTVFLSKFQILRQFYQTPEIIRRVTREAIADAHADGVRYMELRFTPLALARVRGFPLGEVMDWVCESAIQASLEFGLPTRLIVSVNRHESVEIAARVAELALQRQARGILGLDLAGNEADFSALPFLDVFRAARKGGLRVTVHAGEWGGPGNVREAIEVFQADRIGHGVRVVEDPAVLALARECQTAFEVCLTSNHQSGVVPELQAHPIWDMLAAGLNVTVNTDDPSISQIKLSDEFRVAAEELGLGREILVERIHAAAQASFLDEEEKLELILRLRDELNALNASL